MTATHAPSEQPATCKMGRANRQTALIIPTSSTRYLWIKQIGDRLLAAFLLVPALAVIAILIVLIRITSKGPGIYAQSRVGKEGRVFTMYKLRSMRSDAEAKSGPVWSSTGDDPRVTPLGYWLRRLHLDELPQLYNVVLGQMALVGPRPERPEFVEVLIEKIPAYSERLRIAPGITGLAQINLPPDSDLNSVRRKLLLDCEYIATTNFWLDLRILIATGLRIFGVRGGRTTHLLGVQRNIDLPTWDLPPDSVHAPRRNHSDMPHDDFRQQASEDRSPEADHQVCSSAITLPPG